jgi:phosphoglucomutase
MITASHNPREYNGYKVSWEHGGQIGEEIASAILQRMQAIDPTSIATSPARAEIAILGAPMDVRYLQRIDAHVIDRAPLADLKVVYDPLFGCGRRFVGPALFRAGVRPENLSIVEAHANPPEGHALGDFVGLKSPNPASPGALDLAIARAKSVGADIVLSTDPDSDRLVAAIPIEGVWTRLQANETWPVLLDDRLRKLKAKGKLPKDAVVVRSWVTTQLIDKVAADYGIPTIEVPTGFKWIAEQMLDHDVLAGFEESDGMSIGSHTREKDAQLAAVLVAETAAEARAQKKTLADLRDALYQRHGRHEAIVTDLTFEGVEGRRSIAKIRDVLAHRPEQIFGAGGAIEQKYDGARAKMADGTRVTVRPSGTEPKVKVYVEKIGRGEETVKEAHRLLDEVADRIRTETR